MATHEKRALTAHEVAEVLSLPIQTVWKMARRGDLPATRVGPRLFRFPREAIERMAYGVPAGGQTDA